MAKSSAQPAVASDLRKIANRLLNFIWPGESSRVPFREGAVRGLLGAVAILTLLVVPIAIALSVTNVIMSIDDAFHIALVLGIGATGAFANVTSSMVGFNSLTSTVATVGLHPTLLTVVLIVGGAVVGRRFARTSGDSNHRRFHAFGVGVGFAAPLTLIYAASYGLNSPSLTATASIVGPSILDAVIMFAIVAIPAWLGSSFGGRDARVTVWTWISATASRFVVVYSALAALAFLGWLVISWIEPDFAHSTPSMNVDVGLDGGQIALAIVAIVLFIPTILGSALFLSMGASVGAVMAPSTGGVTFEQIMQLINPELTSIPEISALGFLGWWSYPAIGVFVVLVAGIAGVSAARKLGFAPRKLQDILAVTTVFGALAFAVHHFLTVRISWWGSELNAITGESTDAAGGAEFGVTLVSALLLASVVATSVYFITGYASSFVSGAFPRITAFLSSGKESGTRGKWAVVFGRAFSAVFVALFVIPLAIGTTERVWGSVDSPSLIGENLATLVEQGDIETLKASYSSDVVGADEWIDDSIMADALPGGDTAPVIRLFNESGEAWTVGNTDSVVHIKWPIGEDSQLDWGVPTTSNVERVWDIVDHANYEPALVPARVDFVISEYLLNVEETTFKVNGKAVEAGQYALLPGVYDVSAPKYKLLAATDLSLIVTDENNRVVVGDTIELPAGGEEKLAKGIDVAAAKCVKLTDAGASRCFTAAKVKELAEAVSGTAPAKYFSVKDVKFSLGKTTCDGEPVDKLKTASSMTRTVECEQVVNFARQYHKAKNVRVAVQTCDWVWDDYVDYDPYWDIWWGDFVYDCWTSGYRNKQVEGAVNATVNYSATIPITVTVSGDLDAKENFTVK